MSAMPSSRVVAVARPPRPDTVGHSFAVSVKWYFILGLPPPTVFWSLS